MANGLMRTEVSTTTAGMGDMVFQVGDRVRHRYPPLAKGVLELPAGQASQFVSTARGEFAFPVEGNGRFQVQLSLSLRAIGLQPLDEVLRYFQCYTHASSLAAVARTDKPIRGL